MAFPKQGPCVEDITMLLFLACAQHGRSITSYCNACAVQNVAEIAADTMGMDTSGHQADVARSTALVADNIKAVHLTVPLAWDLITLLIGRPAKSPLESAAEDLHC